MKRKANIFENNDDGEKQDRVDFLQEPVEDTTTEESSVLSSSEIQQEQTDKGHEEAIKETVKEVEKNRKKIDNLVQMATRELFRFRTHKILDFFPDQIIIDINKVNIIKKNFFMSEVIHSVFIQDITDVLVSTSPLFATLEIVDAGFTENSIKITHLRKDDALKARRIIQGLIVAKKQGIDMSSIENDLDIVGKLEKVGESKRSKQV